MGDGPSARAGVRDLEAPSGLPKDSCVADLTTAFGIERRAIEDHRPAVFGFQHLHRLVVHVEPDHLGRPVEQIVARELARLLKLPPRAALRAEAAAGTRPLALGGHLPLEPLVVHGEATLARYVGHEILGEAEGVVQAEHDLPRHHPAAERSDHLVEHAKALVEGDCEPVLLLPKDPFDHLPPFGELRVRRAHFRLQVCRQAVEERLAHPHPVARGGRPAE